MNVLLAVVTFNNSLMEKCRNLLTDQTKMQYDNLTALKIYYRIVLMLFK